MKNLLLVIAVVGCLGCSSSEKESSSDGEADAKFRVPENLVKIEELHAKYENEAEYQDLVGTTVSVAGTFSDYNNAVRTGGLKFVVTTGEAFETRQVECYFPSSEILNKCLPGQQVVIEGTVCDYEYGISASLENCRLLDVSGNSTAEVLSTSDLDNGKEFDLLGSAGVLTTKVKGVTVGKNGHHVFVDLECNGEKCIQFFILNNPDADRIKALKPGESIKVVGSAMKSSTRQDYEGRIVLYQCSLLKL